ncbi:hypothetical protein GBZ48_16075 [Azospirillum melinis]|uniref:Uncharacterized protein n=1 Tax=Azospirillum melinis TaxID=328839 RepID=A0ABX2KB17_9PROT|nr:hypothetical protein [Azospirillum melinis]
MSPPWSRLIRRASSRKRASPAAPAARPPRPPECRRRRPHTRRSLPSSLSAPLPAAGWVCASASLSLDSARFFIILGYWPGPRAVAGASLRSG